MTPEQAGQIVGILAAAYPKTEIKDETMALYIQFLLDIPYEGGKAAALNLIANNKFFPSIAELRQAATECLPGCKVPTAAEAWAEVIRQMEDAFLYKRPKFSHPAIAKAVQTMGWTNLCTSENPVADRAHFMQIYEAYRNRAVHESVQLPEAKELTGYLASKMAMPESDKVVCLIDAVAGKKAI